MFVRIEEWLEENDIDFTEEKWECPHCDGEGTVVNRATDCIVDCSACDGEGGGTERVYYDDDGIGDTAEHFYFKNLKKEYETLQQFYPTYYNTHKERLDKSYYARRSD